MSEDLIREVDEEVKRDKLQEQLKRFGPYVVAFVVLAIGGAGAGVFWADRQEARQAAFGNEFAAAVQLSEAGDLEAAYEAFAALGADANQGYRVLAKIRQAAISVELGDNQQAIDLYRELAEERGLADQYRDMAVILGAMLEVDEGDPAALRERLAPLTGDDNAWRFSARELTALLAIRTGDTDGARDLLQGLVGDTDAPSGVRARASELLAALGG